MEEIRLAILGFGSANRSLARMLLEKSESSSSTKTCPPRHHLRIPTASSNGGDTRLVPWRVVCIVTRRHGRVCVPLSMEPNERSLEIDMEGALQLVESWQLLDESLVVQSQAIAGKVNGTDHEKRIIADTMTDAEQTTDLLGILGNTGTANIVVEAIPSDPKGDVEPVISFIAKAFESKLHVVSANKSPLAHRDGNEETYRALQRLALQNGVIYKHESAVMDGVPIFSLWKHTLPHARLISLRGCLNSTTTMILTRMEGNLDDPNDGESFGEALDAARRMGIVEEDEGLDVDGYDAAVKLRALLVYCNSEIPIPTMDEIPRDSIRSVAREDIRRAYENGRKRYRLVALAQVVDSPSANEEQRKQDANSPPTTNDLSITNSCSTAKKWEASVRLKLLPPSDPLYNLCGTDSSVQFCTDVLGPVTVVSSNPTLVDTAYGLFSDIVRVASGSKT